MSIERLQKATVAGVVAQQDEILQALQQFGHLHLIDLHTQPRDDMVSLAPAEYKEALRYLENGPEHRMQVESDPAFEPYAIARQVLSVRDEARTLHDREDFLEKRIDDLKPWGNFHLPDDTLYGERLWFYLVPNYQMAKIEQLELPWECVHRDNRFAYIAVISAQEPERKLLPVERTHTGSVPLEQLQKELFDIRMRLEDLAAERHALSRWILLLRRSLASIEDEDSRRLASLMALDNEQVFALQGWVPESQLDQLRAVASEHSLALALESPQPDELPPTLLSNPQAVAGGEEIVRFYQMPGYRSWDPSRIVFFSFALFFALILSDAGYAAMLGLLVFAYWRKLGRSETGRRMRALASTLTGTSLVYGVLVGSYFGAEAPFAPLASLQLLDLSNFDQMMKLSVVVGAGHIMLANIIAAWQQRTSLRACSNLGWVALLLAGLGYWLFEATILCVILAAIGLAAILLCSSARPWAWSALPWRLLDGLLAMTGISKVFGDVLSYLRLFALGLASASLALTFNQLAVDMAATGGAIGFLLQIMILVLGHLINFVLSVVSGVIHGLRLNLLEFFNWSLSDEGYPFQPFAKKEVEAWTT